MISFSTNSRSRPYLSRESSRRALPVTGSHFSSHGSGTFKLNPGVGWPSTESLIAALNLSIFTKSSLNLKDAIFGNVGTMMTYKIGPEDAEMMGKQFAPVYSDQDFVNMDKFKAAIKLSVDGQPTPGFSLNVPLPWLEK